MSDALFTAVAGWWSLPGLLATPIVLLISLVKLIWPDGTDPSNHLVEVAKTDLAARSLMKQRISVNPSFLFATPTTIDPTSAVFHASTQQPQSALVSGLHHVDSPIGPTKTLNPFAAISLASALTSMMCFLGVLAIPVAIISGHISLYQIKRSAGRSTGRRLAIAGMAIGYGFLIFLGVPIVSAFLSQNAQRQSELAERELPVYSPASADVLTQQPSAMVASSKDQQPTNVPSKKQPLKDLSSQRQRPSQRPFNRPPESPRSNNQEAAVMDFGTFSAGPGQFPDWAPDMAMNPAGKPASEIEAIRPQSVRTWPKLRTAIDLMALSNDGQRLLVSTRGRGLVLFDVDAGTVLGNLEREQFPVPMTAMAWSRDGRFAFIGDLQGNLRRCDIDSNGKLSGATQLVQLNRAIRSIVTSSTHDFVCAGSDRGELKWLNYLQPQQSRQLSTDLDRVAAIHLPSSGLIAHATDGHDLIEFNLKSGVIQKTMRLGDMPSQFVAFRPDGQVLAAASPFETVLFDTATGAMKQKLLGPRVPVMGLKWSADGRQLLLRHQKHFSYWSPETNNAAVKLLLDFIFLPNSFELRGEPSELLVAGGSPTQSLQQFELPEPDAVEAFEGGQSVEGASSQVR